MQSWNIMFIGYVYPRISYSIENCIPRYVFPIKWDMISYDIHIISYSIPLT